MAEQRQDHEVEEADHVYLLMKEDYRISRNVRLAWFLGRLNQVVSPASKSQLLSSDNELDLLSVLPKGWQSDILSPAPPCRLVASTRATFLARRYRFVIELDLSPSTGIVDDGTGEMIFDEVFHALSRCLAGLARPFRVPGTGSDRLFKPKIFITILSYSSIIGLATHQVLVQGCQLDQIDLDDFLLHIYQQLKALESNMADVLHQHHEQQAAGTCNPDQTPHRKPGVSIVTADMGLVSMVRQGILALQLLPPNSSAGVIIITDGVTSVPDVAVCETLLNQLRSGTVTCSFVQVGGAYSYDCSFGYVPNVELMKFISLATFGSYLPNCPDVAAAAGGEMNAYHKAFLTYSFLKTPESLNTVSQHKLFNEHLVSASGNPALVVRRKKHTEKEVHAHLVSVVSVRLREGYTVREIGFTKGGTQLEVKLVLLWKHNMHIEYVAAAPWPLDAAARCTRVEVTMEGSYDILHDISCTQRKPITSPYRTAVIRRFWNTLQSINQTDQMLVHLQSFNSAPENYQIPESTKNGVPLFYIPPGSSTPVLSLQHSGAKDSSQSQFASYWKPILSMDATFWQRWLHMHRIAIILEHDMPVPKHLHTAGTNGRYSTIQCRISHTALTSLLRDVSSFVLVEGYSYVKLISSSSDQPPSSFYLIRLISKTPCMVLRLGFPIGTPAHVRNKIVDELREQILKLRFPHRVQSKEATPKTKRKASGQPSPSKSPSIAAAKPPLSDRPCVVVLNKPLEKLLIRYEKLPLDFRTPFIFNMENFLAPSGGTAALSAVASRTASSTLASLSRYFLHRRWVWAVPGGSAQAVVTQAVAHVLSTLSEIRLLEGFHFAASAEGIINMVTELSMTGTAGDSECERHLCTVQYILFPPHCTSTKDSFSTDEDDGGDGEASDGDAELSLVTEVWVEPQSGAVAEQHRHLGGLYYHQIPDAMFPRDLSCFSTIMTLESLIQMCQFKEQSCSLLPPRGKVPTDSSSPDGSIHAVPFQFNLIQLLPHCQQVELLFGTLCLASENAPSPPNELLLALFHGSVDKDLSDREVPLADGEHAAFVRHVLERERDGHVPPLPFSLSAIREDTTTSFHTTGSSKEVTGSTSTLQSFSDTDLVDEQISSCLVPRWRCYAKSVSPQQLLLTFLPATFSDVTMLTVSRSEAESNAQEVDSTRDASLPADGSTGSQWSETRGPELPVYVYSCLLEHVKEQLVQPSASRLTRDVFFRSQSQDRSPSLWSGLLAPPRKHKEPANHCGLLQEHFHHSYVKGVYCSLQRGLAVASHDVLVATEYCEESLQEIDITNFLHALCGHVRHVRERRRDDAPAETVVFAAGNEDRGTMTSSDVGDVNTEDKLSLKLLHPRCEVYPDLHRIIQDKFSSILSQYFRSVPSNPHYHFYCPPSTKKSEPEDGDRERRTSEELLSEAEPATEDESVSGCCILTESDTDLVVEYEDHPPSALQDPGESLSQPRSQSQSPSDSNTVNQDQDSFSILDGDAESLPEAEPQLDMPPMFLHITCSVNMKSCHGSTPITTLPTCLGELIDCLENGESFQSADVNELSVTLDVFVLTLPVEIEVVNDFHHNRYASESSVSFNRSPGQPSSYRSDEELMAVLEGLRGTAGDGVSGDPLAKLPLPHKFAMLATMDEIRWLLEDEIVSALRHFHVIDVPVLRKVAEHVKRSAGRPHCRCEDVPLQFVFGSERSLEEFKEEFRRMSFPGYMLNGVQEGFFYVSLSRLHRQRNHVLKYAQRYSAESPRYPTESQKYPTESPRYPPESQKYPPESQKYPPESPRYPPESQKYLPESPSYPLESPKYPPESPKYPPESPKYPTESPRYPPESPRYPPESPRYPPESPRYPTESPRYPPESPRYPPESPRYPPESQKYPPESQKYPPESPRYPPESPRYPPESPRYPPESPRYPTESSKYPTAPPDDTIFDTQPRGTMTQTQESPNEDTEPGVPDVGDQTRTGSHAESGSPPKTPTSTSFVESVQSTSHGYVKLRPSRVQSVVSSQGSLDSDMQGYDGGSSDSECESPTVDEVEWRSPLMPNFWLIVEIHQDRVKVYSHSRCFSDRDVSGEEDKKEEEEEYLHLHQTFVQRIGEICRVVNQRMLLQDLHDSHVCNKLLVAESDDDIWKNESLYRHRLNTSDDYVTDDSYAARDYLAATMQFIPGHFACNVVWTTTIHIHPRLKMAANMGVSRAMQALRSVLNSFCVVNRKNMFVYQERSTKSVFYLRLCETSLTGKYSHLDGNPNASKSVALARSQEPSDDPTGFRAPPDESRDPLDETRDLPDWSRTVPDGSKVAQDGTGGPPDGTRAAQDGSRAVGQVDKHILLLVHGVGDAGPEITDELVKVLRKRLDETTLDIITVMLVRNCKLTPADVEFIQPTGSLATEVMTFGLPPWCHGRLAAVSHYLRQNLLIFLHLPKYTDSNTAHHFQHYLHQGSHLLDGDVYLYNKPGGQGTGGKGVACITLSFVDAAGRPLPIPTSNCCATQRPELCGAPLRPEHFQELTAVVAVETSASTAPDLCVRFDIWEQGTVSPVQLSDKLQGALRHALADAVTELRVLPNPLCEAAAGGRSDEAGVGPASGARDAKDAVRQHVFRGPPPGGSASLESTTPTGKTRRSFWDILSKPDSTELGSPKTTDDIVQERGDEGRAMRRRHKTENVKQQWNQDQTLDLDQTPRKVASQLDEGDTGTLNPVYAGTLNPVYQDSCDSWISFMAKLGCPSIQSCSCQLSSHFLVPSVLSEVINLVTALASDTAVRVFEKMTLPSGDVFVPMSVGPSGAPPPLSSRNFILIGRNFQQWRCSRETYDSTDKDNAAPHWFTPQKGFQRFEALEPVDGVTVTTPAKSLGPRQRFLLVSVLDNKVTLYSYNWSLDLGVALNRDLVRLVRWQNARAHVVHCLFHQKMGLFHHYCFSDAPIHHVDSKLDPNPFLGPAMEPDALLRSAAPPPPSKDPARLLATSSRSLAPLHFPSELLPFDEALRDVSGDGMSRGDGAGRHGNDVVSRHGGQLLEIKAAERRELEKQMKIENLFVTWQQRSAQSNMPISAADLETLKRSSRLVHYCATPLLFDPAFRKQIQEEQLLQPPVKKRHRSSDSAASGRDRSYSSDSGGDALPGRLKEEAWLVDISGSFLQQYVQYLQSLGFILVQLRPPSPARSVARARAAMLNSMSTEGRMSFSYVKQKSDDSSPKTTMSGATAYHLQRALPGGIVLMEIAFQGCYFCVKQYALECSRIPMGQSVNSQATPLLAKPRCKPFPDAAPPVSDCALSMLFTEECDKVRDLMHVHSFSYDFHLRVAHQHLAGCHMTLRQGYQLTDFLDDFITQHPDIPKFGRNHVFQGSFSVATSTITAHQLYNYITDHAGSYGMKPLRMSRSSASADGRKSLPELHEYALVAVWNSSGSYKDLEGLNHHDDFDVSLVVCHNAAPFEEQSDVERHLLRLGFYVIMTSQRELFPHLTADMQRFRKLPQIHRDPGEAPGPPAPDRHEDAVDWDETPSDAPSPSDGNEFYPLAAGGAELRDPLYAGTPLFPLLNNEVAAARRQIQTTIEQAMGHCRRDNLWRRLFHGEHALDKLKLARLTLAELEELLSAVHSCSVADVDPQLHGFLTMNPAWYQSLIKVLLSRFPQSCRHFDDGGVQYLAVLNQKFTDCFVLVFLDSQAGKTSLKVVYREPLPQTAPPGGGPPPQLVSMYHHLESVINTACFTLWTGLL